MTMKKYERGRRVTSVGDFENSKCSCFVFNDRTLTRSFLEHWKYSQLQKVIRGMGGGLFEADLIGNLTKSERRRRNDED